MDNIDDSYLRPIKRRHRHEMYANLIKLQRELEIWQGDNVTIFPLRELAEDNLLFGRGGAVDENGEYVELSSLPRRLQFSYPAENVEFHDEKVVYCGYLVNQWGHFLIEAVTRLWYFLENDTSVDKYVFFIEENSTRQVQGNYLEFLELLGLGDKLEIINKPTKYRHVIIPERSYAFQEYYSDKFYEVFARVAENVIPDPAWTPVEKLYFTRSQFRKFGELKEFGYEALDNFFYKNGFTACSPEKVSLSHLIFLIRGCDVLATFCGSLEHNILFAQKGKRLIVLDRRPFNDDNQLDLDIITEPNATYIDANLCIYPTDFGGPIIVTYFGNLERFAKENGYVPPDDRYLTKRYMKQCFQNYMQTYWDQYRLGWYMLDWYHGCSDQLYEAYEDGHTFYREYLEGERPFFWYQWCNPHYIKQLIKRILRSFRR